jgi:ubiquinol-cytochrome c reductase iron-sulfur subunit
VLDVTGEPIRPEDLTIGTLVNGEPAALFETDEDGHLLIEGTEALQVKSKAAVILVRIRPEEITASEEAKNWGIDGILCYSKICTHVGCPISLYEQQTSPTTAKSSSVPLSARFPSFRSGWMTRVT